MSASLSQNSRFGAQSPRRMSDAGHKTGSRSMNTIKKAARARNGSSLEYGVYFAASFLIFLPVVLVNRVMPKGLRFLADDGECRSVTGEAKGMANTVVPFVFMA